MKKLLKLGFLGLVPALLASCLTPPPAAPEPAPQSLLELVENQNLEKIREIFGLNTDVNSVNTAGQSALHVAATKDLADIAAVLLARGALVDLQDKQGNTALNLAVKNSSKGILPILIQYNASLFLPDAQGKSPLQTALAQNPELIPQLITKVNVGSQDASGNTVLHLAASQGLEGLADHLLKMGADSSVRNALGQTALDEALQFEQSLPHSKIAWKLIQQKAPEPLDEAVRYFWKAGSVNNPNLTFDQGNTPLHYAASRGQTGLLKVLTAQGANVNAIDLPGNTPLHRAVEAGNREAAAWLLDQGADVNAKDFNNSTTLHLALTSRNPLEMTDFLLSQRALPDAKDNFGNTPLHLVVSLNLPSNLALLLIAKGADPNARNSLGNSALLESVKERRQELVQSLLVSGADPFAVNKSGESPLSVAIQTGGDALSWLITAGNRGLRDNNGDSALHLAVQLGKYPAAVQYLLGIGTNPNERNKLGQSPLHLALLTQNLVLSQLLIKGGSDIYLLNNANVSPLSEVFRAPPAFTDLFFQPDILELRDSARNTPLFYAVQSENPAMVQLLIRKGASMKAQNLSGSTSLHEAVKRASLEITGLLLKAGASPSLQDNSGNTPLHNLVYLNARTTEMGEQLLGAGAPIGVKNKDGRTVLQEAVKREQVQLATFLLKKKADPNTRDLQGRTPLFDAIQTANFEMVQLLLTQGSTVNIRDATGGTVMHQAAQTSGKTIIDLLLKNNADLFAENAAGVTPAVMALKGTPATWELFFNSGNVNDQNNQGATALHLATLGGVSPAAVQYLLKIGADLEIRNKDGKTAADLAKEAGRADLLNLYVPQVSKTGA